MMVDIASIDDVMELLQRYAMELTVTFSIMIVVPLALRLRNREQAAPVAGWEAGTMSKKFSTVFACASDTVRELSMFIYPCTLLARLSVLFSSIF